MLKRLRLIFKVYIQVYFNSAILGTDPLKEDFLLQNNMQTNSNRYSFMKRPVKRD